MKETTKRNIRKGAAIIMLLALGIGLGFGLGCLIGSTIGISPLSFIIAMLMLFLAYFLNVITHEAGHLVAGLLSGYRFLSFRVLSLIIIKEQNGRLRLRRFSLPGTLGQCLLIPPQLDENGFMPNIFYNLGGVLVNFLNFALSLILYFSFPGMGPYLELFIISYGFLGLFTGLTNGIPMGSLGINNDGANIVALRRNPRAVKALWKQLEINAYQTQGYLFDEMPKELFVMPELKDMGDVIVSAEGVFVENYYMEKMNHESTLSIIDFLLERPEVKLMDIYQILLKADRILLSLLTGKPVELDKATRKSIRQFSVLPNVLVTAYAVAKLYDRDEKTAEKLERQFLKIMKSYPFRNDKEILPKYMDEIREKSLQ